MPKVSVIVPFFNTGNSIELCVLSILNQTYKDFEVVFVNDGSTDDSVSVLEQCCRNDRRVKVLHQQNMGTGEARNTGIRHAQGDYICFVDSDDTVEPEMLDQLLSKALEGVDIVVCDFNEVLESGETRKHGYAGPKDFEGYFKAIMSFQSASAVWAKLFHRKLFDNTSCLFPSNLRNNEDNATLFKLLYFGRNIGFVSEALYNWKRGEGTKSRNINKLRLQETIFVLCERRKFLQVHNLFECNLAEYYAGVLYTITLRKAHIIKFAQPQKQKEYMRLLHTNVLRSKLIDKNELLIIREMNIFDYWRFVFLSLDEMSKESSAGYQKYFQLPDWTYAYKCSHSLVQPEIRSLNYHLREYVDQSIFVYGIAQSWAELKKLLPFEVKIDGYIDQSFEGKCSDLCYDLNSALELMTNNSVIVVTSISQANNIFLWIKRCAKAHQKKPVVITYAGVFCNW